MSRHRSVKMVDGNLEYGPWMSETDCISPEAFKALSSSRPCLCPSCQSTYLKDGQYGCKQCESIALTTRPEVPRDR